MVRVPIAYEQLGPISTLIVASPAQQVLQLVRPPPMPPVSELARDELKLAGVHMLRPSVAASTSNS